MSIRKVKRSVCNKCKMKDSCSDVPGFCLMLPYFAVASIVALIIYFITNSQL